MDYIDLIKSVVNYIEHNLQGDLSLHLLADKFYISKYYFHRIFTAIMGCSLSKYILRRRLNKSLYYIIKTNNSLTTICYSLQFSSPAMFSRAFKTEYGYSPKTIRSNSINITPTPIPNVLQRSFKNLNSSLVVNFTIKEMPDLSLTGFNMIVDLNNSAIQQAVNNNADHLINSINTNTEYNRYAIYLKQSSNFNSKQIRVFFGVDAKVNDNNDFENFQVSKKLIAEFVYKGDLLNIGDTVVKDLSHWLKVAKIELEQTDIAFMQVYDPTYKSSCLSRIYVPIQTIPQAL